MKNKITLCTIIIAFIGLNNSAYAQNWQWQNTNGPPGNGIYCVNKSGNELLAAGYWGKIYRSENNGKNWIECSDVGGVSDIKRCSNNIIGGNHFSLDSGITWQTIQEINPNSGVIRLNPGSHISYCATKDSKVYQSSDCGIHWQNVTYNLPISSSGLSDMIKIDSSLFVAELSKGIFFKNISDTVWSARNNGLPLSVTEISCLFGRGNILYAGTMYSGMYFSNDKGLHWTQDNNGINPYQGATCLAANDSIIYAGTSSGILKSSINGHNWTALTSIPSYYYINGLTVSGDTIFAPMLSRLGLPAFTQAVYQNEPTSKMAERILFSTIPSSFSL